MWHVWETGVYTGVLVGTSGGKSYLEDKGVEGSIILS